MDDTRKENASKTPVRGRISVGPDSEIRDLNGMACELIGPDQASERSSLPGIQLPRSSTSTTGRIRLLESSPFYSAGDIVEIEPGEFVEDESEDG